MKNEIDYRDRFKIREKAEGWPVKCQWCDKEIDQIELKWRVVCDIKKDHEFTPTVIRQKGKLFNFYIIVQEDGETLPNFKEVEASIGTDLFIFFVCSKSCAQKLYEALNEDRMFTYLAEKKRITIEEKKPVRLEFECDLCGKRFWVKWPWDIPKKGDIVKLRCSNCGNRGVKFIRTHEEHGDDQDY